MFPLKKNEILNIEYILLVAAGVTLLEAAAPEQEGLMQVPSVGQGVHWSGHRTSQSLGCFQSVSCAFVPGSRQAALAESQFLHPSHKSHKRSHLPSIRLQLWGYVSSPQSPAGTPEPVTCPLPCVFPAQGVALDMTASLPFLPDSVWIFL